MIDLAGEPFAVLGLAILTSTIIVTCLQLIADRRSRSRQSASGLSDHTAFLLHDGLLVAATAPARALLPRVSNPNSPDLDRVVLALAKTFPTLAEIVRDRSNDGLAELEGADGRSRLRVEWWGEMLRLSLRDRPEDGDRIHPVALNTLQNQASLLERLCEHEDILLWTTNVDGEVTWSSPAFMTVSSEVSGLTNTGAMGRKTGPPTTFVTRSNEPEKRRFTLPAIESHPERTFDVISVRHESETLHLAVNARSAVKAEALAENYVQTFSRTFAELDVGLAIFDQHRRLVMFNPAMTHLLRLSPDFLIRKPLIEQVLDHLRSANMLPEPKDYRKWRARVADLEAEALNGTFAETWNLPDGRVYRVTGRPHPQGAIALLIEDISADVAMSRRYRAEFETTQSLLDSFDDAIAVFSNGGTLRLGNARYAQDWGASVDSLGDARLEDEVEKWKGLCAPSPVWEALMRELPAIAGSPPLTLPLRLRDGRGAELRAERLSTGDCCIRIRTDLHEGLGRAGVEPHPAEGAGQSGTQLSARDG